MNLNIQYATKERKYINPNAYQNVSRNASLWAVKIVRSPCGSNGAARNRYYYTGEFDAPEDAEFVHDGRITAHIVRGLNPKFDPKKYNFVGNCAEVFSL